MVSKEIKREENEFDEKSQQARHSVGFESTTGIEAAGADLSALNDLKFDMKPAYIRFMKETKQLNKVNIGFKVGSSHVSMDESIERRQPDDQGGSYKGMLSTLKVKRQTSIQRRKGN